MPTQPWQAPARRYRRRRARQQCPRGAWARWRRVLRERRASARLRRPSQQPVLGVNGNSAQCKINTPVLGCLCGRPTRGRPFFLLSLFVCVPPPLAAAPPQQSYCRSRRRETSSKLSAIESFGVRACSSCRVLAKMRGTTTLGGEVGRGPHTHRSLLELSLRPLQVARAVLHAHTHTYIQLHTARQTQPSSWLSLPLLPTPSHPNPNRLLCSPARCLNSSSRSGANPEESLDS